MSFLPLQQLRLTDDKNYTIIVPTDIITSMPVTEEYQKFVLNGIRYIIWEMVGLVLRSTYFTLNKNQPIQSVDKGISPIEINHILFDIEGYQSEELDSIVVDNPVYAQYILELSAHDDNPIGRYTEFVLTVLLHSLYWNIVEVIIGFYYLGYTLEIEDADYHLDNKNFYILFYITNQLIDINSRRIENGAPPIIPA
jgi:hypothetical protein